MVIEGNLCAKCKGSRRLCGRPKCPILIRISALKSLSPKLEKVDNLFGSSPPSVLVGEWGYPKIRLGGLIPPETGIRATFFDNPVEWTRKKVSLDDIIRLRSSLVYSRFSTHIKAPRKVELKFLENTQELAMAAKPTDVEVDFLKPPRFKLNFDGIITPVGIMAPIKDMKLAENPVVPRKVEYLVSDTDVKASTAMWELYNAGTSVYQIFRILSVGLLGIKEQRRLVPTRWAITAVDKNIGDKLLTKVRSFPEINWYLVFHHEYLGNHFELIFIPRVYSFEVIEMWMPRSVWVRDNKPSIFVNWEFWDGKAQHMDGGYYAIRLPVLEYLSRIKRQATVIAIREIRPEYYAPVGNWQIRENVRRALSGKPERFNTLQEALNSVSKRLKTEKVVWLPRSYLLKLIRAQKTLNLFF
jgi:hypothetical protein